MGLKQDSVFVSRGDGAGYLMTTAEAKKFVKNNPDYSVMQRGESSGAKAVDADDAEDKAVASPRRNR